MVSRTLGLHMDVDGLFVTGSTQVAKYFMEYAAQSNLKKIDLELGGKSPKLILKSYRDTAHAAQPSARSAFFNLGEMCTCSSRLIVERSAHDEAVELLTRTAAEFVPGDPLDPTTTMGALVDRHHTDRVLGFVDTAREDGADLRLGGIRARADSGDRYGLTSAVCTDDLSSAHQVSRGIRAGHVYVNCYDCDGKTVPIGGFKQSGIGRDKSLHALDKCGELKTTWIALGRQYPAETGQREDKTREKVVRCAATNLREPPFLVQSALRYPDTMNVVAPALLAEDHAGLGSRGAIDGDHPVSLFGSLSRVRCKSSRRRSPGLSTEE